MTVLLVLPKTILVAKNLSCSCTTCIVYVNLFKDRSFCDCCSSQKADAKVRTFKHYFQMFSEVFSLFFLFPSSSLLSKGRQKEKEEVPRHRLLKEECQLALLSFPKAGAKVRTFKYYFQMFQEVFFLFSFPSTEIKKKTAAKKGKRKAYRSVLPSECQSIAASVPESGCKSRPFNDIRKIYDDFFLMSTETFS